MDNVERVQRALACVFDDASIDEILAEDLLGEFPAVQYVRPTGARRRPRRFVPGVHRYRRIADLEAAADSSQTEDGSEQR